MEVEVRLFAMLRERAGCRSITLEVPEGATVAEALDAVGRRHDLGELLGAMPVVMAVNREYASRDARLSAGDELALIPPVSGGAPPGPEPARAIAAAPHVRVTQEPLSLARLAGMVGAPGAGAIVTFQGTTRDVERLEYEAYREMAAERMATIVAEAIERHSLVGAAAEHRIGSVPIGAASVIVAASAAHRGEAFAGAREIIDRIKAEAPIWKKEVEGGGERWVEGRCPPADNPG